MTISRPVGGVETLKELTLRLDVFQRTVTNALKQLITFTRDKKGLVPPPGGSGSTRFLCEDGTWRVP